MQWIPLNCKSSLDKVFAEYGDQIAAVVIEPIMGNCGSIAATDEYMKQLRKSVMTMPVCLSLTR